MYKRFQFDGYTVRPLQERDREFLTQLIEADPYHRGRMTAAYFFNVVPGEESWALEDERGEVVFYFRTTTAVRISIQFRPVTSPRDRSRNRRALMRGLRWIEGIFREHFFREIITDTEGPELRAFARNHLGFRETPTLIRQIGAAFAKVSHWGEIGVERSQMGETSYRTTKTGEASPRAEEPGSSACAGRDG